MASKNAVQSVLRALDLLAEISASGEGMSLRDLCRKLQLKPPTVHNLLRTLKMRGFVRQTADARYALGPALFELSGQCCRATLLQAAEAAMRVLFADFAGRAVITFAQPFPDGVRTVLRLSPNQPTVMQRPNLVFLNQYLSATSLVVHAFADEETREHLEERYPYDEHAGVFAGKRQAYQTLLDETRARGYAVAPLAAPGRFAVAAPVFDKGGRLAGIFGVSVSKIAPNDFAALREMAVAKLLAHAQRLTAIGLPSEKACV